MNKLHLDTIGHICKHVHRHLQQLRVMPPPTHGCLKQAEGTAVAPYLLYDLLWSLPRPVDVSQNTLHQVKVHPSRDGNPQVLQWSASILKWSRQCSCSIPNSRNTWVKFDTVLRACICVHPAEQWHPKSGCYAGLTMMGVLSLALIPTISQT